MADIHPGGGSTIKQLLHTLQEQLASTILHKPPDLTLEAALEYVEVVSDVLTIARYLVNSFSTTIRVPPEILNIVCSYLTTEEDVFSASQVCHHWRGVLTSSPSLWTRFSCRRVSWTIASLERCKSIPIQMEVYGRSLSVALEKVSLRGAKIASLTISLRSDRIPQLLQLLTSSASSVEQLHILCEDWEFGEQTAHEFWQGLASLRQLFASEYFIPLDQLRAPNLVHLTLDEPRLRQRVALQSILNALRGCPRLETLFISDSCSDYGDLIDDHSLVSLPRLRTIELGPYEVQSYLVTHLQLPPNIAAGFRMLPITKIHGAIPLTVVTAMRHVLGRIDIRCITLAVPPCPQETPDLFIRFEGLQTSLEITSQADTYEELREVFFGPRGVLFSHSPRINNVRELRIIGCPFADGQVLDHINVAMPNIVSISFFHCEEPHVFVRPPQPALHHLHFYTSNASWFSDQNRGWEGW